MQTDQPSPSTHSDTLAQVLSEIGDSWGTADMELLRQLPPEMLAELERQGKAQEARNWKWLLLRWGILVAAAIVVLGPNMALASIVATLFFSIALMLFIFLGLVAATVTWSKFDRSLFKFVKTCPHVYFLRRDWLFRRQGDMLILNLPYLRNSLFDTFIVYMTGPLILTCVFSGLWALGSAIRGELSLYHLAPIASAIGFGLAFILIDTIVVRWLFPWWWDSTNELMAEIRPQAKDPKYHVAGPNGIEELPGVSGTTPESKGASVIPDVSGS